MCDILFCIKESERRILLGTLQSYLETRCPFIDVDDEDIGIQTMRRKLKNVDYLVVDMEHITETSICLMSMALTMDIPIVGLNEDKLCLNRWSYICDTVLLRDELLEYFQQELY